jgi:aryl-alcohol dehydrogenase-like predicted oxidoreductase
MTDAPNAAAAGQVHLGDLIVNRLGYGAMRITGQGIWGPPKDHDAAIKTLRRAVELGVNFIDTADSYGPNVSEELIAEALSPYPKGLVIATKGGWERVGPGQWIHNASPKHLEEAVEGSLKRLKLDRIDVYQLHISDPAVSFDASMETLEKLRQNGKIRHLALSNVALEYVERARKITTIVSVQNRYSFADREPLGQNRQAHDLLDKFAKELEATPLQVALAWLLRRSPVTLPIPGTSSPKHLEENIGAASLKLPDAVYKQLEAVTPPPASLR